MQRMDNAIYSQDSQEKESFDDDRLIDDNSDTIAPQVPPSTPLDRGPTPSTTNGFPTAVPSSSPSPPPTANTASLPDSVRGAPEELKPAIRKKQNKESARRSRRRRKELVSSLSRSLEMLLQRSADVEARVSHIEQFLSGIGFQKLLLSSPSPTPVSGEGPMGSASAPPSRSESIGIGSHSEAGSRNGRSRDERDQRRTGRGEDDEVQRLIERCMGQL